jgi:hypothetical protein
MVCANCDFKSPCACERRRLAAGPGGAAAASAAAPSAEAPSTAATGVAAAVAGPADLERARTKLRDAANMIAALLLAADDVPESLQSEAEELLAALRAEDA